jgi:hypothetical protein
VRTIIAISVASANGDPDDTPDLPMIPPFGIQMDGLGSLDLVASRGRLA